MTQKYQVKVSMKQAAIVETGIVLKQGDFGMQIEIEVLDFDATGTTPQIVFRKAMGAVESTTITVSSNKYTYTFKGTELDTPGKVFCDLKLKNSTTQRISTASFMFKVVADTLDGLAEESSSYSDTIEQVLAEFKGEVNNANGVIEIRGVGTKAGGDSGVTGNNQYFVHTGDRKLRVVSNYSSPTSFADTIVPFDTKTIYIYKWDIYYYSGSNDFDGLIKANPEEVINIRGVGTKGGGDSGVTRNGQYFVHSGDRKLRIVSDFVSSTNFTDTIVPFDTKKVYIYNWDTYYYSGSNDFDGLVRANLEEVIKIQGIGTKTEGNTGVTGNNQYFVHSGDRKLRKVKDYVSSTNFTEIIVPFNVNTIYLYKWEAYYYSGSNNFDGLVKAYTEEVINIRGVGTKGGGDSGVTGNDQYFVHSGDKKLRRVSDFVSSTNFTDTIVPFDTKKAYIYKCELYYYSGSGDFDGLMRGYKEEVINIRGVGTKTGGNSGVTENGQYFVHSGDRKLRVVTNFVSSTNFIDTIVPFDTKKAYIYKCELYYYSGSGDFDGLIKSNTEELIFIRGLGTKAGGNSGVTGNGQYFVHSGDKKLRIVSNFVSSTNFTDTIVPFDENTIYFYGETFYKYNGANDFNGLTPLIKGSQSLGQDRILPTTDMDMGSYARGMRFSSDIGSPLIDFKKPGDLMVHVSTFCIIDGTVFCSYYANTRSAAEDPTEHTARLAYCSLEDPTDMVYIDIQDVGDTFDGKTVQKLYDTILMRKDDETIYVMWTAMMDGVYYRLYRTIDVDTKALGNINYNQFYFGESGGIWSTETMRTALANVPHRDISGDIGIMQKLTTREEDGTLYYYSGAYADNFNCVIKSADLIDWHFVACPDVNIDTLWENAVYVKDDTVFYFVRMQNTYNCGALLKYDLINAVWSDPIYVSDAQSRSDFIFYNNKLYLFHAPFSRYYISAMRIDTTYLNKSFEFQNAKVNDCFYPYVDIYNDELYMSYTQSRQHIYLSKINIYDTYEYSDDTIRQRLNTLIWSE